MPDIGYNVIHTAGVTARECDDSLRTDDTQIGFTILGDTSSGTLRIGISDVYETSRLLSLDRTTMGRCYSCLVTERWFNMPQTLKYCQL